MTIEVFDRAGQPLRSGSGVVLSASGRVITNYHVVAGGAFFEVRFPPAVGTVSSWPARPFACAEDADLALLSVASDGPLPFARTARVLPAVGERVFAIGSPLDLAGTLSEGVVSQLRSIDKTMLVQTTAQISPGSSGGGLFLASGELVGITTMTVPGGQNLNFAVSVSEIPRLESCSLFAATPTPQPTLVPTAVPKQSPDCKSGLSMERFNATSLPRLTTNSVRLNGVVKNVGCGTASGVRVRVEILDGATGAYVASRSSTVSTAPLKSGQLFDFEMSIELPYTTQGKDLTFRYSVRDLDEPF